MPQVYFDSSLHRVSFCPPCISFSKLASFRQCTKGLSSLNKLYFLGWLYFGSYLLGWFLLSYLYLLLSTLSLVSPLTLQLTIESSHVSMCCCSYQSPTRAFCRSPLRYPLRAPRLTDSVLSLMLISSRPQSLLLSSFSVLTGSLWNQPEPLIIFLLSLLPRSASLQRACSGYCYCGPWYEIFQDLKANQRLLCVTLG